MKCGTLIDVGQSFKALNYLTQVKAYDLIFWKASLTQTTFHSYVGKYQVISGRSWSHSIEVLVIQRHKRWAEHIYHFCHHIYTERISSTRNCRKIYVHYCI